MTLTPMNRSNYTVYRWVALATAVTLFLATTFTAYARSAWAVELIGFTAVGLPNGVRLSWQTATEQSTYGFLLQRSQGSQTIDLTELTNGDGQPYPGGLIEAEGSPTMGSAYIADDLTAVPGQTYTYHLLEIEGDNSITVLESYTVVAGGAASPTAVSIDQTATTAPQSTASATNPATAVASPTPSRGATTAPTNSANPQPSQTAVVASSATAPSPQASPTSQTEQTGPRLNDTAVAANTATPQPTHPPNNSGVVLAQTLDTPDSPYPGQFATPAEDAYPEWLATPLSLDEASTAYPGSAFTLKQDGTATAVNMVGHNAQTTPAATAVPMTPSPASAAILWGGFVLGILIFLGATLTAITVFARRNR